MAAPMPGEKGDLAAFQIAQDEAVGRLSKRGRYYLFSNICQSGHGIQPASAYDADLRLLQTMLLIVVPSKGTVRVEVRPNILVYRSAFASTFPRLSVTGEHQKKQHCFAHKWEFEQINYFKCDKLGRKHQGSICQLTQPPDPKISRYIVSRYIDRCLDGNIDRYIQ